MDAPTARAANVGDGFHCGRQAFLGRPEARWKLGACSRSGVDLGIVGLDPLRVTGAAVEALAVTLLQPQSDWQVGRAALPARPSSGRCKILHQPLVCCLSLATGRAPSPSGCARLPARSECVGRSLSRARRSFSALCWFVVAKRALQSGAQLSHRPLRRGDGIARRVPCDAQGFHPPRA